MKYSILFFAIVLFSTQSFAQATYSKKTLEKIKEVENNITGRIILNDDLPATIAERMAQYNVKGMSIAVIQDYKIAWAKGYGWADEAEKKPVTTETLFEPGSISKSLNAIGILKLAQDKKIDLNTDINTYLKSWEFPYDSLSNGKKITIAQLLSHTAGLTVHGFPGHDINGPMPTLLQVLNGEPPSFTAAVRSMYEPGLRFEYSGGGTSITQMILTDITGATYDQWMYDNVLKPIGMTNSSYAQPPSKDKQSLCATAYNGDGTPIANKFHVYPEQAAAGLWMTPSDLCQYIIDMQQAYRGRPSKVLDADMVKLHLTTYNDGPTTLGSFIEDRDGEMYFSHSAGNDGFCGHFFGSLKDGYGMVVFLNTDDFKLAGEVINSVAKVFDWKKFYNAPIRRKTITVSDAILDTYTGIYLYDDQWSSITKSDAGYLFTTGGQKVKMHFINPTTFFNEEFSADKEFIKDDQGIILGYKRTVNGKEFPMATRVTDINALQLDVRSYTDIGWYLMEMKDYLTSLAYFKRGAELYPEDVNSQINLAHLYLYNNDYKNAIVIYKQHLHDTIPGTTWEQMLILDWRFFKDHGMDVKMFDKVFEELGMEKPGEQ